MGRARRSSRARAVFAATPTTNDSAASSTGQTSPKPAVRKLGETIYDITPYRYEIQHRHVFHLRVHEPTERRWPSQELHDGQQPPTRLECFWIPLRDAHVLQAGQGALIGAIFDE